MFGSSRRMSTFDDVRIGQKSFRCFTCGFGTNDIDRYVTHCAKHDIFSPSGAKSAHDRMMDIHGDLFSDAATSRLLKIHTTTDRYDRCPAILEDGRRCSESKLPERPMCWRCNKAHARWMRNLHKKAVRAVAFRTEEARRARDAMLSLTEDDHKSSSRLNLSEHSGARSVGETIDTIAIPTTVDESEVVSTVDLTSTVPPLSRAWSDFIAMANRADLAFKSFKEARAFLAREAFGCGVVIDGSNGCEVMIRVSLGETSIRALAEFMADYGQAAHGPTVTYTKNGKHVRASIASILVAKIWRHIGKLVSVPYLPSDEEPSLTDGELNIFPGYAVKPVSPEEYAIRKEELEGWLKHTDEIICSGDVDTQRWVRAYVACLLALPRERCTKILILRGVSESGRGAWLTPLRKVLGDSLVCDIRRSNDLLTESFTKHCTSPRLIDITRVVRKMTDSRWAKVKERAKERTMDVHRIHTVDAHAMYVACVSPDDEINSVVSNDGQTVLVDVSDAVVGNPPEYWSAVCDVDPSLVLTWALRTVEEGTDEILRTIRKPIKKQVSHVAQPQAVDTRDKIARKSVRSTPGKQTPDVPLRDFPTTPLRFFYRLHDGYGVVICDGDHGGVPIRCPRGICTEMETCECEIPKYAVQVHAWKLSPDRWMVSSVDLYADYRAWCRQNGDTPRSRSAFRRVAIRVCDRYGPRNVTLYDVNHIELEYD